MYTVRVYESVRPFERAYEPFSLLDYSYTQEVSADFDTVAGTVGRANWLGRPLLFPGETGTWNWRIEDGSANKVQ